MSIRRTGLAGLVTLAAVLGWQPAAHALKTDIPNVKIPDIKIPKIDLPKIDVPKVDVPKVDVPKVDVPKIDVPKINVPDVKVGVPSAPKVKPTSPIMGKLPANPNELPSVPKAVKPTSPAIGKLPDNPNAPKVKPANPVMGKLPDNPNAPKKIYDTVPPLQKQYVKLPPEPSPVMGKLPADPNAPKVKPANPVMGKLPDNPNAPKKVYDTVPPLQKQYVKLPPEPSPVMGKLPTDPNAPKIQYDKLPNNPQLAGAPKTKLNVAKELGQKVGATPEQIKAAGANNITKNVGKVGVPEPVRLPGGPKIAAAAPNAGGLTKIARAAQLPAPAAIVDALPTTAPAAAKAGMKTSTKIMIVAGVTMVVGTAVGISAPHVVQKIVGDEPAPETNTVE